MRKPDNSSINLSRFTYQLSEWLPLVELGGITGTIQESEGRQCYGKYYIIKRGKAGWGYAVFTRGLSIDL